MQTLLNILCLKMRSDLAYAVFEYVLSQRCHPPTSRPWLLTQGLCSFPYMPTICSIRLANKYKYIELRGKRKKKHVHTRLATHEFPVIIIETCTTYTFQN